MAEKHRVTLYLEKPLYDRFRSLVASVPGLTLSGVVGELLEDFVPVMEDLTKLSEAGDKEAQAEMMALLLGRQFLDLAQEGQTALRQFATAERKKEPPE